MPHDEVAKKYGVQRARVKDLQESAGKFALMVAAFCECLGWDYLDILISKFQVSCVHDLALKSNHLQSSKYTLHLLVEAIWRQPGKRKKRKHCTV